MELAIQEPRDIKQLKTMLGKLNIEEHNINVIVEGNIFSIDGKWLLKSKKIENQEKLETIYSKVDEDKKIVDSILKAILEQIPGGVYVNIKKFLYARTEKIKSTSENCIVLSYIGILESTDSKELELKKDSIWQWYPINQIKREDLTVGTSFIYGKIRENWQEIQNILNTYKKFNQKYFEKYFFYGMENRENLIEGIIYYTNRDLTRKYLEIKQEENLIPIEKQLENLKRKAIINCEQLYRFIVLPEKEGSNFSCKLNSDEKRQIQDKIISKINQLIDSKMLLFFRRGIFYDDRIHGNDPESVNRVNKIERICLDRGSI